MKFKPGDLVEVLEDNPCSASLEAGDICVVVIEPHPMTADSRTIWVEVVNPSRKQRKERQNNGRAWYVNDFNIKRVHMTKVEKAIYGV